MEPGKPTRILLERTCRIWDSHYCLVRPQRHCIGNVSFPDCSLLTKTMLLCPVQLPKQLGDACVRTSACKDLQLLLVALVQSIHDLLGTVAEEAASKHSTVPASMQAKLVQQLLQSGFSTVLEAQMRRAADTLSDAARVAAGFANTGADSSPTTTTTSSSNSSNTGSSTGSAAFHQQMNDNYRHYERLLWTTYFVLQLQLRVGVEADQRAHTAAANARMIAAALQLAAVAMQHTSQ